MSPAGASRLSGRPGRRGDSRGFSFTGDVWEWRGPAPFYFITVPDEQSQRLRSISKTVTYGWGMIPVRARIGSTEWKTSLFPKEGRYVLPIRDAVRGAEGLARGDTATVRLTVTGLV
ncbi:MAG TPA: DUF1905 domain-containing protein [Candidatus Dormibacteraeota bacterium]|jgi:hypothetical protein|nr:DUF1905 domain-containing protein [Candidatus Dormibacteraeota bacterium]